MPRTKIVCTLGPASADPAVLRALVNAGMRVARINFSHGTLAEHAEQIRQVRRVAAESGVPVAILADLCGPKIRTGALAAPAEIAAGREFVLSAREPPAPGEIPLGLKALPQYVRAGTRILFDDGELEAVVTGTTNTTITCRPLNSGLLGAHKGINLPGLTLPLPAVTDKDREDLRFALRQGVDWVAMSFVRRPDDLAPLRSIMQAEGIVRPVISKIEKHEAVDGLDAILAVSDGLMVARGDLGVEVSLERVPGLQKEIIRKANRAGKPVITATQMLDSMIRNPRPTRAEVTDVANAILDGTDAVMLSGETAVGAYPVQAVRAMAAVAEEAERLLPVDVVPYDQAPGHDTPTGALAAAAVDIARTVGARAILASTQSGYTALLISKSKPALPIIGVTPRPETLTQLPLFWGVTPLLVPSNDNVEVKLDGAIALARQRGLVQGGNLLVVVAIGTVPGSHPQAANFLRLEHVSPD